MGLLIQVVTIFRARTVDFFRAFCKMKWLGSLGVAAMMVALSSSEVHAIGLGAAEADSYIGEKLSVRIPIFNCLLYTSPSPRDGLLSRMPSSA